MIFGLFRNGPSPSTEALYAAIVTEARHVAFYSGYGVPDTPTARFDMIVLHLALVARRLRADPAADVARPPEGRRKPRSPNQSLQDLTDLFFREMDRALREMGVGDVAIPKRMTKLHGAFAGRSRAYDAALDAGDPEALAAALARNILTAAPDESAAAALAAHVLAADAALAGQSLESLLSGRVEWPDPTILSPGPTP